MGFLKNLKLATSSVLILLLVSGCGSDANTGRNDRNTNFRFINSVSDVNSVDLYLDNKEYQTNVGFLESTGYSEESSGGHNLQVLISGTATRLVDTDTSFSDVRDQTLLVFGKKTTPSFLILRDDNEPSSDQTAKIRVIHASSNNRRVDAYVLSAGTSINSEQPSIDGFNFRQVSTYIALPKGQYDLTVTPENSKTIAAQSLNVTLDGESVYTILVSDSAGGGQPPRIVVFKDF